MVQAGSGGQYQPNPKEQHSVHDRPWRSLKTGASASPIKADGFDVEKVCEAIDPDKVWKTPGQADGGIKDGWQLASGKWWKW